jgi:subtilisin-like proprotein convertase family protein
MSDTYTYRGGVKLPLDKRPDQFVVRAEPGELRALGITDAESVSAESSRVTTRADELEPMMARSRTVAPTHHAYELPATGEEFLITDRVIISFKQALPAEKIAEIAGRYGLRQVEAYSDRDFLFQLTNHTGMNPVKLVVALTENEPLVAVADHDLNYQMNRAAIAIPTDPAYARQWHLHGHFAHPDVDPRANARVESAWQKLDSFGSRDVVVGVTDDGCKLDHPDFDSAGKFAAWGYFDQTRLVKHTDADAVPALMHIAPENHGTACAGVIAGEADAVLTVGAAPGCRLLPIRWQMTANGGLAISDSKMLAMLGYVADKVDVLSNSWGGVPVNIWALVVVNRIRQLALTGGRRGRGIVFLWAAGNENCLIQADATSDVPYTWGWQFIAGSWTWVGVETTRTFRNNLVGVPGVMHIAALASTAQRSRYSNYGPGLSVCAPTSNSDFYQRLRVRGLGITTATGETGGVTDDFGGTSSATPLTAGIAALVISANPNLTALEVVSTLQRTAAKDLDMAAYPRTPAASYDPNPTWDVSPVAPYASGAFQNINHPDGTWSPWFGHGRVDAAAAVTAALGSAPPGGGEVVPSGRRISTPALAIPDNNPAGVRDTIIVAEAGTLNFVRVSVDITHTFIGDLKVTLIAPSGKTAVLHDRSGGSANNLAKIYDDAGTSALRGLLGEAAQGSWTLAVQDLAAADVGQLAKWELELGIVVETVVEVSEAPGLLIPDNVAAGIERTLAVTGAGTVGELSVSVDITHTYIGDLQVALVSPSGRVATLHARAGGSADNLIATYTSANVAALRAMVGERRAGAWRLRVADLAKVDIGKLNRWSLRVVRQAAAPVPAAPARKPTAGSAKQASKETSSRSAPARR